MTGQQQRLCNSRRRRRRSVMSSSSLMFLLFAVMSISLLLFTRPVSAQRTIASFGTKLKNLASSGSNKQKQQQEYIVLTGERQQHYSWKIDSPVDVLLLVSTIFLLAYFWRVNFLEDYDLIVDQENLEDLRPIDHVDLGFEDILMTLKQKGKNKPDRIILDGSIRGRAQPGRMLAIMGPSGSGKSTLIHALAGKVKENRKLKLYGKRYINGELLSGDSQVPAAFIEQEVNFFPHMTVKETLDFRVELKLGKEMGKSARDDVVSDLMDTLSLTKSANTIVGDSKIRGISGGERKRLSIACEMISSPSVIMLDEPTSGLDSYQATQVVETLRNLADSGKTIIAVIHQPSQHVFAMFDDLLVLSEGKQMYFGERSAVRAKLEAFGYVAPREMGTAEHVLECVSRVNEGSDEEVDSIRRINDIAEHSHVDAKDIVVVPESLKDEKHIKRYVDDSKRRPKTGVLRQFKLLLGRSLHEVFRGKGAIIIKTVQQVSLGLIYGGIYHLGNNQASILDRFGLLSLIAIGTTNMAMASTIRSFPKEKAIVSSEMATKLYRTFPYFLAKAISEIPLIGAFTSIFASIVYHLTGLQKGKFQQFLGLVTLHSIASEAAGLLIGAVSASSDVALALFPPIVVLNIIFDGRNISEENTPKLLRWIPKVGLVRWGFEGLALNEFDGLEFETGGPRRGPVVKTGEDALDRFGLLGKTVVDVVKAQSSIIAACWFMSFMGLSLTKQKYMVMLPSKPGNN